MIERRNKIFFIAGLGLLFSPAFSFASDSLISLEVLGTLQQGLITAVRERSGRREEIAGRAVASASRITLNKDYIHVLDGDTLFYGPKRGRKLNVRILGIDTPEVHHYAAGKFEDQEYGQKVKEYVRGVIYRADKVEALLCGEDIYDRTLAHIYVDGRLLSVKVLKKGYAYETITYYGDNGQPELASEILEAAKTGPRPPFENPYRWRKRMWSEEKEQAELRKDLATPRIPVDKSQMFFQDGDTVYFGKEEVRILGVDTPEIAHPEHDKPEGQEYGPEAAEFTKQALLGAKKVEYILGPGSTYGRSLAHVFVDGELLSLRLIQARLAYETVSRYGAGGFPGYARQLLDAFHSVETPPFQNPQYWRWEHWGQPKPEPVDAEIAPPALRSLLAY
ncbi:MAG: thermonuclease family protein [Elusimicrobia bacterium]|nr:thermonuclease family protein [Elusimicrobiota bacterium]